MLSHHPKRFFRLFSLLGVFVLTFALTQGCETKVKPECETNKDCGSGKFCNKGKCKRLACESDADCANGEQCKSGACVKGTGPTEKTSEDGGATDTDPGDTTPTETGPTDTSTGDKTSTGPCGSLTECKTDSACGGDKCIAGCCLPKCDKDKPCPGTFKCKTDSGQCVVCLQDGDCPVLGQKCDQTTGTCGEGVQCPGGKPPGPDGKCVQPCADAKCGPTETPDPDASCKCIPKVGACESCTKNAECGLGNHCVEDTQKNKFCAIDCTTTSKCDPGYQCLSLGDYSVCMPSSGFCPCLGVKCQNGQKCCKSRGTCTECCEDSDCTKTGEICRADGSCGASDPCKGVTCQPGQQCNSSTGKCGCASPCPAGTCCGAGDNTCSAGACGGPGTGTCKPACTGGMKCCKAPLPGLPDSCQAQCTTGPGSSTCKTDADCTDGVCCAAFGNKCIPAKDPVSKILMKLICGGGNSGGGCKSDADCPTGKSCKGGLLGGPKSCQ